MKLCPFILKLLTRKEVLKEIIESIKENNCVTNVHRLCVTILTINAYTNSCEILSICSQDRAEKLAIAEGQ